MATFPLCNESKRDEATEQSSPATSRRHQGFLDYFDAGERSPVNVRFLDAVRKGAETPEAVVASVMDKLRGEMVNAIRFRSEKSCATNSKIQEAVRAHPADAAALAEHALWWERLTKEEKNGIRAAKSTAYIDDSMDNEPPTAKQLAYLRHLGSTGEVRSKLEASRIISDLPRRSTK